MRLALNTAPPAEPILIADVEEHSRLGAGYIAAMSQTDIANIYISAIRQRCEAITRRQLINATWDLLLDGFPYNRDPIEIPLPPLQSITNITYVDPNGNVQTLPSSTYRVICEGAQITPKCQPGMVFPVYGTTWPATLDDFETVTICFVAGYGADGSKVPEGIKNWMLLNIANLWENRETETMALGRLTQVDISTLADGLLEDYRIYGW